MGLNKISIALLLSILSVGPVWSQSPAADSPALEQRVNSMLAQMPLAEKLSLLGGQDGFYTHAAPSIGLKRLKMSDGPVGLRTFGPSTAYVAQVGLAASWDTDLARRVGAALGADARARGVNFLLAPGVDIYRSPLNGRNMEYLGEDPYLAGRMAVGYIDGVQSMGVSATVKHFAVNNSEFDRHNINAIVDERTLREIYLPAFEAAVKEGHVRAVMDSYNLVNGEHSTQNSFLNKKILKGEWGFDGVVMSDWNATYDGVAAANGGLDLEMPFAKLMTAQTLTTALKDGRVKQATIDDKVRRLLRVALQFGWMDRDQYEPSIPLYRPESNRVALDEARESITLLKNDGGLLPLNPAKMKTIAIIGPEAASAVVGGGGSSSTTPFKADSVVAGFASYLHERVKVMYVYGLPPLDNLFSQTDFAPLKLEKRLGDGEFKAVPGAKESNINHWRRDSRAAGPQAKASTTYRWSGDYEPAVAGNYMFVVAANDVDGFTLTVDGKMLLSHTPGTGHELTQFTSAPLVTGRKAKMVLEYTTRSSTPHVGLGIRAKSEIFSSATREVLRNADAVLVCAGFGPETEGEGFDRTYAMPDGQNEMIQEVAALNPRTIVAITAGGSVETEPWIGKVPALLDVYYPGQEGAQALAEVLFGERSPEGHLPFSWERTLAQNPASSHYAEEDGERDSHYAEGLFLGYRYYTSRHEKPLFPFGFGLSYTKFDYTHLTVRRRSDDDVEVSFDVRNAGQREGAAVAQIYVGDPSAKVERPVMELKQFTRVLLKPGAVQHVVLHLNRRAFSYFDVESKNWHLDPGRFTILLAASSEDVRARQDFEIR